jgi:hypothetical protein
MEQLELMIDQVHEIYDSLIGVNFDIGLFDILEIEDQIYLLPDARFEVYRWENDHWHNLYVGSYYGYNYSSKKFTFQGDIYSYGGYGYWRKHGDLIKFFWDTGQWELIPYDYNGAIGKGTGFVVDSILYILSPGIISDGDIRKSVKDKSKKVDLRDLSVRDFDRDHLANKFDLHTNYLSIETDNYVYINRNPMLIYEKASGLFYSSPSSQVIQTEFTGRDPNYYMHVFGDSIVIFNRQHTQLMAYDLNEVIGEFNPVEERGSLKVYFIYVLSGLLLITIVIVLYLIRNNRTNHKRASFKTFDHPMILNFLSLTGKTLSSDQIDELFGITDINQLETLRYRRSVLINEINLEYKSRTGKKLIQRIKNPDDKRRFLYKVG